MPRPRPPSARTRSASRSRGVASSPGSGEFDEAALERYARLVVRLDALGLEPVVTLLHYTHPRWFHDETPWTSTASVDAFARFAARTARALGPKARCWTVLNEPLVLVLGGFLDGQVPPGIASARDAARALDHLLAAHEAAAAEIRAAVPGAAIGVAHNMMGFAPERARNPFDRALVRVAGRFYNQTLLDAFGEGRWSAYLPPFTRLAGRRPGLPASLDFFGVNYYSRLHLRFLGDGGRIGSFAYRDPLGRGLTDNGWEVVPEAFLPLLRQAASLGKPLLVTENGLADAADTKRAAYLESHVAVLAAGRGRRAPRPRLPPLVARRQLRVARRVGAALRPPRARSRDPRASGAPVGPDLPPPRLRLPGTAASSAAGLVI